MTTRIFRSGLYRADRAKRELPTKHSEHSSPARSIPIAPQKSPVLGHLFPLWRDPLQFLSSLQARGPMVRISVGPLSAVVVCDPALTHTVLHNDRVFDRGGPAIDTSREFAGYGLATCPHSMHRRLKRLVHPAFNKAHVAAYAPIMSRTINELTNSWQDGKIVNLKKEFRILAATVTTATLFTHSLSQDEIDRLVHDADVAFVGVIRRALMPHWLRRLPILGNRKYWQAISDARIILNSVIESRRKDAVHPNDLLSALIDARDADGSCLSDIEIRDQAFTFFLGGTGSTAALLMWAVQLLDQNPEVAARLYAEVDAVLGGRPAAYEDLPNLSLTGWIIAETLRLYPSVWLMNRIVMESVELGGYSLPAGTALICSPYLVHQHPDLHDDIACFSPDRWNSSDRTLPPRSTLLSFGGGPRKCVGEDFATTEAILALATIASRWKLESIPGAEIHPALHASLQPRKLRMRAISRKLTELAPSKCDRVQPMEH